METEYALLQRLRDLRKRRAAFRSAHEATRELARLRSLLAPDSIEREVFESAEIRGNSYKSIAAELNISERHLYRIRSRMIAMIEAAEADSRKLDPAWHTPGIEHVALLIKHGKTEAALAAAARLASTEVAPADAIGLLCLEAIAACERADPVSANQRLGRAAAIALQLDELEAPAAERRIAIARAYLPYYYGRYEETIERCENALRPWIGRSVRPEHAQQLGRDFTFLGIVHQEGGSPERALAVLDEAERILRESPNPGAADLANVYVNRSYALASIPDRLEEGTVHAERAFALAHAQGLCFELVWGKLALGVLGGQAGNGARALFEVREALDLARTFFSGDPLVRSHCIRSRIEILAGGDIAETLNDVAETEELLAADSLMGTIVHLSRGRLHHAAGDAASAHAAAGRAIDAFERRKTSTHYLGESYLARAVAGEVLGLDVREDAERAVELLTRGGFLNDQRRANALAARVRRNGSKGVLG